RLVSDPAALADGDFPGIGNASAGTHQNIAADFRAETTQQEASPAIKRLRRAGEQACLNQLPQKDSDAGASAKAWGKPEAAKVLNARAALFRHEPSPAPGTSGRSEPAPVPARWQASSPAR